MSSCHDYVFLLTKKKQLDIKKIEPEINCDISLFPDLQELNLFFQFYHKPHKTD